MISKIHGTYGEDPSRAGQIGKIIMLGIQGNDPNFLKGAACAIQYDVHSGPEALRHQCGTRNTWRGAKQSLFECGHSCSSIHRDRYDG